MGEKKELRDELALVKASLSGALRGHEQLLAENEVLREQLAEGVSAPPFRLVTDARPTPTRERIAIALGIEPSSYQMGISDEMILEAVERLRNPALGEQHPDAVVVSKGDSLAEAIHHNRAERVTLETSLVQSRNIVNRVAGALSVSQWGHDGDELVEKAQRFGVFWHFLRKRLREFELEIDSPVTEVLRSEFRTILAALVGDKELARILQNKPIKASKTVLDLAEAPAPTGKNLYLERPFDREDVLWIRDALRKIAGMTTARAEQLMLVFERIEGSPAATAEFVAWMNAVVLPVLRKQHPAYASVKEN